MKRTLLIAGPTASGKSGLAIALAQKYGATIVNADSMQVYRDLRVLTARPSEAEEWQARHELFGTIDGAENFSAGRWLAAVTEILEGAPPLALAGEGRGEGPGRKLTAEEAPHPSALPPPRGERDVRGSPASGRSDSASPVIFVGGTGLYFRTLTQGLSAIPHVPDAVREKTRADAEARSTDALHEKLTALDPLTAARLRPSDRQRILRALEVFAATGAPLASFHGAREAPLLQPGTWAGIFLAPERAALNGAIERRFAAMLRAGALDEVAALAARKLDPALPVMRAHGVPHLIAYLNGDLSLDAAAEQAKLDTRHYAKRQFTWARHQMPDFAWIAPDEALEAGQRALDGFLPASA